MKRILLPLLFFVFQLSFSQGIKVDTLALSVPELVQNVLLQSSCSEISNFKFSSHRGIGQFTNTNPEFPITNGIILRNGLASYSEGIYTGNNLSSRATSASDADLQTITNNNGQSGTINDVTYLQFDFTPLSNNFSFDFLFASNEYGDYQCGFNDVFAFILTDLTTNTQTNLAVIPGTTTPVSVKYIRDNTYNSSCLSANANLFGRYNVNKAATSAINMNGQTVLLTATSPVIPNRKYRIKLAIGDNVDENYDSAVFIKGGSFTTATDLGANRTICQGETFTLNSGLGPEYSFKWQLDGVDIPGETKSSLSISKSGTYKVIATFGGCEITDDVKIRDLKVKSTKDLVVCNTNQPLYTYDLTQNDLVSLGLNSNDYDLKYFDSLANATANSNPIPDANLKTFQSPGNQTIYIKVIHTSNSNLICNDLLSFNLSINNSFIATTPPDIKICNTVNGKVSVDLTQQTPLILNGLSEASYTISYFTSQADADANANAITTLGAFATDISKSPQTIYVRMDLGSGSTCYSTTNFKIIINPLPLVDKILDVVECSSYKLLSLANGNYYDAAGGTGNKLNAGDIITKTGKIYIYNGPTAEGCFNETSFNVTIIKDILFKKTGCGKYVIKTLPAGNFYTGPGGTGTMFQVGDVIATDQTIYYYAEVNGVVCRDEAIPISILALPPVDDPADIVTCNGYILPTLVNGNYFTETGGKGKALNPGVIINSSQDVFVYVKGTSCPNENVFRVEIIDVNSFNTITACTSFKLPDLEVGNYYDQPKGQGNIIPSGAVITQNQVVYYYYPSTTATNCTDNLNYNIKIYQLPVIDKPIDVVFCDSYTLPKLVNGNYFTDTNGGGKLLVAGDVITKTQDLYVFSSSGGCTSENKFKVTIKPYPAVDNFTDVFSCDNYTLPKLSNGKFYTETGGPNGLGKNLLEGTIIDSSQTIYIFNSWIDAPTCFSESVFKVIIAPAEVGTFADVNVCDSYTLPILQRGNYYSQPGGIGPTIPVGTVLTTSQTIYVYNIVGTRLSCSDQDDFVVTISVTPDLGLLQPDIERCYNYALPVIPLGGYFSESNGNGNSYTAGDLISTTQKMYIFAAAPTNLKCFDEDMFNITVYPLKNNPIVGGTICVDIVTGEVMRTVPMVSGIDPNAYKIEWNLNGQVVSTASNFTATKEGTYNVVYTKKAPNSGSDCGYNPSQVVVEKSGPAVATTIETAAFENTINIEVQVKGGYGEYEFQLDNGAFQDSPTFLDVESGEHIITIHDKKGDCANTTVTSHVLKYPNYFTPNGDGVHETWNIFDLSYQPKAYINIFDRHGKFIKQIKPNGPGWDGTLNDELLPASDYWFQAYYNFKGVDQEFKSHFSLKR